MAIRHTTVAATALALTVPALVIPAVATSAAASPATTTSADASTSSCTAPTYKSTKTLWGASLHTGSQTFKQSYDATTKDFGKLGIVRVFDASVPPSNAWTQRTSVLGSTAVNSSFRMPPTDVVAGKYDTQLKSFFSTAPTNIPVFWTYYHEPEKPILQGKFTMAQFKSAWIHIAQLAAKTCKANLYPTLVLTGYTTQAASKRNWKDYYPGASYVSVISFDPYNNANGKPTSYPDPSTLFASVAQTGKASGKPWGIAETGSGTTSSDGSGSQRAQWVTKMGTYFKQQGAIYVSYFNTDMQADFKLDDSPSKSAYRNVVTTY